MAGKPKEMYVERRPDGQYAVLRPNAERASALTKTQEQGIKAAARIDPAAAIHVERQRHTTAGKPNKWRKV